MMEPKAQPQPIDADLEAAQRALRIEAEGLAALARSLDQRFRGALDLIAGIRGRVVVTGIGKSGHIAHKIASTLASTGTPAVFVHAGEASHGDLGMITKSDAVLALSNSGETAELSYIVAYARRYDIPLIAVTGRENSSLSEAANAIILLPAAVEACPMGLAPTTSTTMMLALGDAIAIALLERRGFKPTDFHVLHPGGHLGRQLLRVADIMHRGEALPLVGIGTSMADALVVMTEKRFGCIGVTDGDGRLVGIFTDGDLRRHMAPGLLEQTAGEVMTRDPKTTRPQALVAEALGFMNANAITNLFVVEGDAQPRGILHIHDCLRAGVS